MTVKSKRERSFVGVLFSIMVLFVGSALVRLIDAAGPAFAVERSVAEPVRLSDQSSEKITSDELNRLLLLLNERENSLDGKERELSQIEGELSEQETVVSAKLIELAKAEKSLRDIIAIAEEAAENDLTRLTAVYEKMKPKDAARLFGEMDAEFAAGFLARMKTDISAQILASMDPKTAYAISAIVAGRHDGLEVSAQARALLTE